jgi:DNA-directed RNA polymerase specialized sigma24 family protein
MNDKNPSRDWVVGSLGNSQRTSLWLSGVMNNFPDPIRQLVVELDVLSRTSRGRALHTRLRAAGIDARGSDSVLEIAHDLEWNPRTELSPSPVLEQLVALTSGDQDVTLVLLVALRRVLREMAFAIGRMNSDQDVAAEILVELLAGVAVSEGANSLVPLLDRTYRTARRFLRHQDWQVAREVPWEIGDDVEEIICADLVPLDLLEQFVDSGAITLTDAEVIRLTRVEGVSLDEVAKARRVKYQTVKRRRNRAETAIRGHLRDAGES